MNLKPNSGIPTQRLYPKSAFLGGNKAEEYETFAGKFLEKGSPNHKTSPLRQMFPMFQM